MIVIKRLVSVPNNAYDFHLSLKEINRLLPQLSKSAPTLEAHGLMYGLSAGNTYFFVAIDEDRPLQFAGMALVFFQWRPEGWMGEIHSVVVDEFYEGKGRGVGSLLMERILITAKIFAREVSQGFTIYLTCKPERERAHHLYEKFGFQLAARAEGESGTDLFKLKIELPEA